MATVLEARVERTPANADECAQAMSECARERWRVGFVGGATELSLGNPPSGLDAVIRTRGMARVLEYAPSDMVITVEAGVTLAEVHAVVGAERQMLALDAPHPDRATLGGVIATGAFGPRRARYGAVRDLIIGVTLVRADGVVARGGGKVVKNVAGFDLPKVVCGSLGTLGLVATATFRLHPLPDAAATVVFPGLSAEAVVSQVERLRQAQLEPTSVVALGKHPLPASPGGGGGLDLGVRFEGFERAIAHQVERACGLGAERLSDEAAVAFWARHDQSRMQGALRIKVATLPSRLVALLKALEPLMDALRGGAFVGYASLGLGFVSGDVADAPAVIAALRTAREALVSVSGAAGSLVVEEAPADVRAGIDPWGPAAAGSLAVMGELKQRFDPERRLNPGRFIGGL
ncbi:FAD-binding oxidoreductase [Pendulispora rubella]|uniref:FAD-binding oxidoreductase n=1 Tax=Pendulispora rubella TaxID=2741070 RepID=A0ABZ2L876_9BACT